MCPSQKNCTDFRPHASDLGVFIQAVRDYVKPDVRTILDVGACDGYDAMLLHQAFPSARTIAVEALQENYERYCMRLPIETVCAVIGETEETRWFFVKEINGIHSLYDRGCQYGSIMRQVKTLSLEKLCRDLCVSEIQVMKLDVEGSSWDVLQGAGPALLGTLQAIHVETEDVRFFQGQHLKEEVDQILTKAGLSCIRETFAKIEHGKQYDSIWIRT